mgnify:CR=1 FL=1
MDGWQRAAMLGLMWAGAVTGIVVKLVAFERFKRLGATLYIVLGWLGVLALPALLAHPWSVALMTTAGILYTVGAALFAAQRPKLSPTWFGYHEVWHALGVTAGVLLFVMNLGLISAA